MPQLWLTYDGQLICQASYEERKAKGTICMQNGKIVVGSVHELAYDIPKRNLSTS